MPIKVFDRPPRIEAYPVAIRCPRCKLRITSDGPAAMEGQPYRLVPADATCPRCRAEFTVHARDIRPIFR